MAEDIGVGGRAGYYDGIGAARDVIQNHLLQLLALTAMEEPISFDAADLRAEKEKVLAAVRAARGPRHRHRARAVRRRLAGRREGRRLPRRRRHEPRIDDRDLRRDQARRSAPAAGRACRSTCARASASAGASPRSPSCSSARPQHLFADSQTSALGPERARDPRAARRGRHDPVRLEGAGRRHAGARRHDGLRLRPRVHRGEPRGLRAAHPRRAARRPAAVPPPRGGRALAGRSSTRSRSSGRRRDSPSSTAPAPGGRAPPTSCSPATARTWRRP